MFKNMAQVEKAIRETAPSIVRGPREVAILGKAAEGIILSDGALDYYRLLDAYKKVAGPGTISELTFDTVEAYTILTTQAKRRDDAAAIERRERIKVCRQLADMVDHLTDCGMPRVAAILRAVQEGLEVTPEHKVSDLTISMVQDAMDEDFRSIGIAIDCM